VIEYSPPRRLSPTPALSAMGRRVGGGAGGGVEWSGGEGSDTGESRRRGGSRRRWQAVKSRTYVAHTSEKGGLGLNPNRPRGSAS
jgi:hypothetical protein